MEYSFSLIALKAAVIVGLLPPKLSTQKIIAFNEVARQSIRRDPDFLTELFRQQVRCPTNGLGPCSACFRSQSPILSDDAMGAKFAVAKCVTTVTNTNYGHEFLKLGKLFYDYQGRGLHETFWCQSPTCWWPKHSTTLIPARKPMTIWRLLAEAKRNANSCGFFTTDWRFAPWAQWRNCQCARSKAGKSLFR